jgi:hypothetical protein
LKRRNSIYLGFSVVWCLPSYIVIWVFSEKFIFIHLYICKSYTYICICIYVYIHMYICKSHNISSNALKYHAYIMSLPIIIS